MQLALAGGAFLARPVAPKANPDADIERRERRLSASCDGFDVHCAVRIAAGDDQGRERLVRYCARPPFALLACPRCARKMRVLSTLTDLATIRRILTHLGVRADPLPRAPARDPTEEQIDFGFDADAA